MSVPPAATTPPANPAPDPPAPAAAPDPVAARKEKREHTQSWIDTWVKVFQAFVVFGGGLVALYQFLYQYEKDIQVRADELTAANEKQKEEVEARKRALHAKFYDEQRAVYLEACQSASRIAAAKSFAEVQDAVAAFQALASGPLRLVADQDVVTAVGYYADGLTRDLAREDGRPSRDLHNRSVFLSLACRKSLKLSKVFGFEIDPLSELPLAVERVEEFYSF